MKKTYGKNLVITEPINLDKTQTARNIYWQTCDDMFNAGSLDVMYIGAVASYANAQADVLNLKRKIKDTGGLLDEEGKTNPYVKLRDSAETRAFKYIDKLGLSPRSTVSLKLNKTDEGEEETDDAKVM